jgi:hypothetical protein
LGTINHSTSAVQSQYYRHKPADCEGKAHKFVSKPGKDNKRKAPDEKTTKEKKLELAKAYQATLDNTNNNSDTLLLQPSHVFKSTVQGIIGLHPVFYILGMRSSCRFSS